MSCTMTIRPNFHTFSVDASSFSGAIDLLIQPHATIHLKYHRVHSLWSKMSANDPRKASMSVCPQFYVVFTSH